MDIIQTEQDSIDKSRAKEIDHGTTPLPMTSAILNLPPQPGTGFDNRSSVNATKWAFEQLISQKQLMTTISITPGLNDTVPIFIFQNSWDNIYKLHFRNLADLFFVKSWKWHLTFEFRSNFQEVGMMSIAYANIPVNAVPYITGSPINYVGYKLSENSVPRSNGIPSGVLGHSLFGLKSINQLPHKHVMLGENQDVQCTFEWLSPYKAGFTKVTPFQEPFVYADIDDPNDPQYDMGFVFLSNTIPLTTASGVTPHASVRIWSHLTDVEYAGYCPDDTII